MSNRSIATARSRLNAILAEEILNSEQEETFPLPSETQLCERFAVSRQTLRVVLSDLESRGLIFRRQGKGTFAHGRNSRRLKPIGVVLKMPNWGEQRLVTQFLNGVQNCLAQKHSSLFILLDGPETWNSEIISKLGGLLAFPYNVTLKDISWIEDRKIPFLLIGETDLPGPQLNFQQSQAAADMMKQLLRLGHRHFCFFHDENLIFNNLKLHSLRQTALSAGLTKEHLFEINAADYQSNLLTAAHAALHSRPTAIITLDDSLAGAIYCVAQQQNRIIPKDFSIASFHDWSFMHTFSPRLHTVHFPLAKAGAWAANALLQSFTTGEPLQGLSFPADERPGESIGPAPSKK